MLQSDTHGILYIGTNTHLSQSIYEGSHSQAGGQLPFPCSQQNSTNQIPRLLAGMEHRGIYASSMKSPTRLNALSPPQVYSPRAGYIRDRVSDRVSDLKDLLNEHEENAAGKLLRARADLQQLSTEKERALRQQQRNLQSLEQLSEQVRRLSRKLQESEERCDNYRAGMKKMKVDMQRIMDVNASLQDRLASQQERLFKLRSQFRRQHRPQGEGDEVSAISHYIQYLDELLEEGAKKLEAEAGRNIRMSKELDGLIAKYKTIQAESADLSQQLNLQVKQREIEQIDSNRLQEQFSAKLNQQQLRLKKTYEAELSKTKEKSEHRKQKNQELKAQLLQAQKALSKANSNIGELVEEVEDANTQNHLMSAEVEELKSMLSQASREMGILQDQYGQLKSQLVQVEKELVRRGAEAEQYRESLKTATFELENAQHERRLLREKLLEIERRAQSTEQQGTKTHKQLARADDQCQQLRRDNRQLKETVQDLRRIVARLEESMLRQKKEKDELQLTILHPDPQKDRVLKNLSQARRKDFLERIVELQRFRDSPLKQQQKSHKLKVIGQLQSMLKTHKQIYQTEPENA